MSDATEAEAIVSHVEGDQAVLQVRRAPSGCGRCHEPGGCGGGLLTGQSSCASVTLRVHNTIGARAGDAVLLTVASGSILRAALLSYGMAVLLLLCGAWIGTWLSPGPSTAMVGGGIGLVAATAWLVLGRRYFHRWMEPLMAIRFKNGT